MHGHVTLTKYDIGNYKNEDFIAAQREKRLDILLKELEANEQLEGDNQILNSAAAFLLYSGGGSFGSAPAPTTFDSSSPGADGVLWVAALTTRKNILTYGDYVISNNVYLETPGGTVYGVGAGTCKRFIEDAAVWTLTKNSYGRQEATLSSTFVWLPLEAISTDISSLCIWNGRDLDAPPATTGYWMKEIVAQWRFRTSTGQLTTIKKSEKEALALRYDFILTAH